jgi:tetratricopeptide (TPR) repeat protein
MYKSKLFFSIILIFTFFISCKSQADKDLDEVEKLINSDRCSDAIQLASKMIEKYPNDARFYYNRGYCYLRTSVYKAKEDFSICVRIDPKYHNCYYGLASVYETEGHFDLAEKNYNKAIELALNKNRKGTFTAGLATLYNSKKDLKKAIETIKKAIEFDDEGQFYLRLGDYLFANGQKKEAESTWLKAISEKQFTQIEFKHETYARLAGYYFLEKDYKKSKDNIEKAIELAPNNNDYIRFFNLVKAYVK